MFRSLFCVLFMCYSVYRLCVWVLFCVLFMCYSVYRLCVWVLFYVPFMYYSVYCFCVILCTVYVFECYSVYRLCIILCTVSVYSVYSITATGCQLICSLLIIIICHPNRMKIWMATIPFHLTSECGISDGDINEGALTVGVVVEVT